MQAQRFAVQQCNLHTFEHCGTNQRDGGRIYVRDQGTLPLSASESVAGVGFCFAVAPYDAYAQSMPVDEGRDDWDPCSGEIRTRPNVMML